MIVQIYSSNPVSEEKSFFFPGKICQYFPIMQDFLLVYLESTFLCIIAKC